MFVQDGDDEEEEGEEARDVAKAMAVVRPLLQQYENRYDELALKLSQAQAGATSATREARQRCQGHCETLERVGESCAAVGRDLAAGQKCSNTVSRIVRFPGNT